MDLDGEVEGGVRVEVGLALGSAGRGLADALAVGDGEASLEGGDARGLWGDDEGACLVEPRVDDPFGVGLDARERAGVLAHARRGGVEAAQVHSDGGPLGDHQEVELSLRCALFDVKAQLGDGDWGLCGGCVDMGGVARFARRARFGRGARGQQAQGRGQDEVSHDGLTGSGGHDTLKVGEPSDGVQS